MYKQSTDFHFFADELEKARQDVFMITNKHISERLIDACNK